MKVLNIHQRVIDQPKEKVSELLATLSTRDDKIWPYEKWPAIKFKEGLREGSKGNHGPIKYIISKYIPGEFLEFTFTKPKGFKGVHFFKITQLENNKTEVKHVINMKTSGTDSFTWAIAIRWLHDALVEDAFDKMENQFSTLKKQTPWHFWVRFLRKILK